MLSRTSATGLKSRFLQNSVDEFRGLRVSALAKRPKLVRTGKTAQYTKQIAQQLNRARFSKEST